MDPRPAGSAREVAGVFLRLGTVAFGGPAAHIAMMREELVQRRHWVDDQRFADLMGATNLIPGPNSTELAIHIGYLRAGWPGLVVAGVTAPAARAAVTVSRAEMKSGQLGVVAEGGDVVDVAGACVDGILDQLLERAGGAFDHLARGDAVDQIRR